MTSVEALRSDSEERIALRSKYARVLLVVAALVLGLVAIRGLVASAPDTSLVGEPVPAFDLPDLAGEGRVTNELLTGRVAVINLWASWCAPCRRENREVLAPLWAEYRDAGLAIVGYALDSSPEAWQAAIRKDGASWAQASHLGGDVSPFLDALRVTTIPANLLLDADGKIVARNLHGQALKDFVRVFVQ